MNIFFPQASKTCFSMAKYSPTDKAIQCNLSPHNSRRARTQILQDRPAFVPDTIRKTQVKNLAKHSQPTAYFLLVKLIVRTPKILKILTSSPTIFM